MMKKLFIVAGLTLSVGLGVIPNRATAVFAAPVSFQDESQEQKDAATQEAADEQEPTTLAERYAAVIKKYNEAMREFRKVYSEAEPDERQKLFQEKYPQPESYAAEIMSIAREHAKDPATVEGLKWVAQSSRGESQQEALDIMFAHHFNSDAMADIAARMAFDTGAQTEKRLRHLAKKSTSKRTKGIATYSLARYLAYAARAKQYVEESQQAADFYKDKLEYLKQLKVDNKELIQLYEIVQKDYADVTTGRETLGESAESALFELRNLQIGMVAPDIVGADLDGVEFKLTDYRGKVVLLDFWGHW